MIGNTFSKPAKLCGWGCQPPLRHGKYNKEGLTCSLCIVWTEVDPGETVPARYLAGRNKSRRLEGIRPIP